MRVIRNASILAALLFLMASPAMADFDAGLTNITRVSGYYAGNGGEFTLWHNGLSTSAYSALTKNVDLSLGSSFQTFCIETDEYVMPPTTDIHVTVSTTNVNGSPGSHAIQGGSNTNLGDDLDSQTAYLYTKFATGTLTGYQYTGAGRSASAQALQQAIWYIEQESIGSNANPSTVGSAGYFVKLASDAVASGGEWFGKGIGNVRVLNLYEAGVVRQDQLYLVPVPGGMLLAGLGLALLGWFKRRLA